MKTFTDIEQSKKLAEILPFESADMFYNLGESNIPNVIYGSHSDFKCYLPCWSLMALLNVSPLPALMQDKAGDELFWQCSAYSAYGEDVILLHEIYDNNPVDACYRLIIGLRNANIL